MKVKTNYLLSFLLMMLFSVGAFAQVRMVSGTVTDTDGETLIGVSVVVVGTTTGTATDIDGKYTIAAKEGDEIEFSYVGYEKQNLTVAGATLDVVMSAGIMIDDVVVTALGISRDKKALGYAVQEVAGDDLKNGSEANFVNTLAGKVSGVQIQGGQNIGGSSRILIRGANSILGENQPLFVVDGVPIDNSNYGSFAQAYGNRDDSNGNVDYGNAAQDINPNDIESVSVLKGAMAAALYGSRGSNGVILITTKSGKAGKPKIELSFGTTFDKAWDFPALQNEYGGGTGDFTIGDDGIPMQNVTTDQSWGPKLDGQMVRQWDGVGGGGEVRPWVAHPDNYKNFFETGVTETSNIAVSGGSEAVNYRLAFTRRNQKGIVPNSSLKNNTISLNLGTKYKKLSIGSSLNYYNRKGEGRPSTGSGSDNISYNMVIWTQRQLDLERLKTYENPDGSQHTWRTDGFDKTNVRANNPYWLAYKDVQNDSKDRLIGNVSASYEFTKELNLMVRAGQDWYVDRRNTIRAVGSRYTPYYFHDDISYKQQNYDVLASYKKGFGDISLNSSLGGSLLKENIAFVKSRTNGGLNIANVYTIANSIDPATVTTSLPRKEIQSIYASVSLGYKNYLYMDITGRNDWSSTLPEANNSFFYPSVTGSLVFSELFKSNIISFGKARIGWGQVGKDTNPYRITQTYYQGQPVGGNPIFRLPSSLNNPALRPEITTSFEGGLEMKFLKNRAGFDLTLYKSLSKDQILPITVSPTTLYSSKWVNAGELQNKGIELGLNGSPIKTKDFEWNIGVNWARNRNKVVALPEGIKSIVHAKFYGGVYLESRIDEPFSSIYAIKIARDSEGRKLVQTTGTPGAWLPDTELEFIGSVLPDWTAGLYNDFSFKSFNLSFLLDMQKGGVIFLRGYQTALYAGTLDVTTANNIREDGIVLDGYLENGEKNTTNLSAINYSRLQRKTPGDHTVFDASFVKLREISFGYDLPAKLVKKAYFTGARLAIVGRNLAILQRNTPQGYDPESAGNSSGNIQGREYGQLPGARSIGFNLSLSF